MAKAQELITLACCSVPRLDNLKKLLPRTLPYIDRAVIVTGERDSESEAFLDSLDNVEWHYYPWEDNFAKQWNNYLKHVDSGWVLIVDDDEIPSEGLLQSLGPLVDNSDFGNKFCIVEFRCHNISEGQLAPEPANYWRQIFYRYNPNIGYRGGPQTGCHQYRLGYQNWRGIRSDAVYYHDKPLLAEYRQASRNYFIYGIWLHGSTEGVQREEWHEMKSILAEVYPTVKTFADLNKIMIKGNIHLKFKEWMVKWYTKFETHPEYNEMRAVHDYYFKHLHPEEAEGV